MFIKNAEGQLMDACFLCLFQALKTSLAFTAYLRNRFNE